MKEILLVRLIVIVVLVIAIIAPFTFLKPNSLTLIDVKPKELVVAASSTELKPVKKEKEKEKVKVKIKEKPLHQVALPDFSSISDISTKKRKFFSFIRPAVEAKNKQLADQRKKLEYWHGQISLGLGLEVQEQVELQKIVKAYRINEDASELQKINALLIRVDIIPTSLVLVQAANESAWGTSRFARIGLNFFGIWCYKRGCGMVPGGRDTGAKHEVAAFQSVDASISGYFNNINKHNAYYVFRAIRAELRAQNQPLDPTILATGLLPYSQRGTDYVLDVIDMLRHNKRYFKAINESALLVSEQVAH